MKLLLRYYEARLSGKYYEGIDYLPIFNWWKIHETGETEYLLYEKKKANKIQKVVLARLWEKIYDEYIVRFGLSEEFADILKKQKEIARLIVERITTGDKSILTLIKIAELELEMIEKRIAKGDFNMMKGYMEQGLGFSIDTRKTTVAEFYSYIKVLKHGRKQGKV